MGKTIDSVGITPGEWRVMKTLYDPETITVPVDYGFYRVAVVSGADKGMTFANARLIAAAPDLLRLLEDAIPYIEEGEQFNKPSCRGLSKAARAAIAKATGAEGGGE